MRDYNDSLVLDVPKENREKVGDRWGGGGLPCDDEHWCGGVAAWGQRASVLHTK